MGKQVFRARGDQIRVARVMSEDDKSLILEVEKSNETSIDLFGGERFLTLVFVHADNGAIKAWVPWEESE
jgi:hypothetical protein